MIRDGAVAVCVLLTVVLSGCNLRTAGTPRALGDVEYASAFATGREVMGQHFSIASADVETGVIQSRPRPVKVRGERLLGGSPARHVATLRIVRRGGEVVAYASVVLQREGSSVYQTRPRDAENYDSVPDLTPAEELAATTPDQNEVWRTERHDRALERRILDDLYKALHPQAK